MQQMYNGTTPGLTPYSTSAIIPGLQTGPAGDQAGSTSNRDLERPASQSARKLDRGFLVLTTITAHP